MMDFGDGCEGLSAVPDLKIVVTDPGGGMVLRWTLVAEVIESDGTEALRTQSSEGVSDWTRLGLLGYAAAAIRPDAGEL